MRFCTGSPTCQTLTDGGPCPVHALEREQRRGHARARGYSRLWEREAARFKREFPFCGNRPCGLAPVMSECADRGILTPAYAVDHVTPHKGNQRIFWDIAGNWQSLCQACHARKSKAGL